MENSSQHAIFHLVGHEDIEEVEQLILTKFHTKGFKSVQLIAYDTLID